MRDTTSLPGGRGFVFPAERVDDGAPVGLKIIEEEDSTTAPRIEACYAALRRHPHPNLIEPLSLFLGPGLFSGDSNDPPDSDSDLLYLAYRWIEGDSLRAAAPLDSAGTARLATDLAAAISHLHGVCWLIHRDIHPGNIVIDDTGRAALIDIDAWVEVGDTGAAPASGVLGFLPPERGRSRWDERSDVWALGMVVNYAILGHPTGTASIEEVVAEMADVLPRGVDAERVASLIGELTHAEPDARRTDLVAWAEELTGALSARPSRRTTPSLVLGAGVVAVAALAGVAFGWWMGDDPAESPPGVSDQRDAAGAMLELGLVEQQLNEITLCPIALGEPGPDMAVFHLDDIERWADDLVAAAPDACAVDHASVYGQAAYQLVDLDGDEMVVFVSEHGPVLLHPVQMASYQQLAGRGLDLTVHLGGYPVEVLDPRDGVQSLVRLSEGGLVVGRRLDTQGFWMPEPVLDLWESRGGFDGDLGLPMTNPYTIAGALQQDFERGFMRLPITSPQPWDALQGDDLEVILVDPSAPTPTFSTGIARQSNGTAWWIADGQRYWIPDGGVWVCLGGHDNIVAPDIDGASLATFELGPPATCEMEP